MACSHVRVTHFSIICRRTPIIKVRVSELQRYDSTPRGTVPGLGAPARSAWADLAMQLGLSPSTALVCDKCQGAGPEVPNFCMRISDTVCRDDQTSSTLYM